MESTLVLLHDMPPNIVVLDLSDFEQLKHSLRSNSISYAELPTLARLRGRLRITLATFVALMTALYVGIMHSDTTETSIAILTGICITLGLDTYTRRLQVHHGLGSLEITRLIASVKENIESAVQRKNVQLVIVGEEAELVAISECPSMWNGIAGLVAVLRQADAAVDPPVLTWTETPSFPVGIVAQEDTMAVKAFVKQMRSNHVRVCHRVYSDRQSQSAFCIEFITALLCSALQRQKSILKSPAVGTEDEFVLVQDTVTNSPKSVRFRDVRVADIVEIEARENKAVIEDGDSDDSIDFECEEEPAIPQDLDITMSPADFMKAFRVKHGTGRKGTRPALPQFDQQCDETDLSSDESMDDDSVVFTPNHS